MTAADDLRAFDPNKPEFSPWATWVSYAGFKIHRNRSIAITRYNQSDRGLFYEMGQDGLWREVMRKCREDENHTCSVCGATTLLPETQLFQHNLSINRYIRAGAVLHDDSVTPYIYDAGRFLLERKSKKIIYPYRQHFLCVNCWPAFA
jgi:hypothetical protein